MMGFLCHVQYGCYWEASPSLQLLQFVAYVWGAVGVEEMLEYSLVLWVIWIGLTPIVAGVSEPLKEGCCVFLFPLVNLHLGPVTGTDDDSPGGVYEHGLKIAKGLGFSVMVWCFSGIIGVTCRVCCPWENGVYWAGMSLLALR